MKVHLASGTSVVGLLKSCRPSAIFRRISALIVDAVDCVLRRWFSPHVLKKIGESLRTSPAAAYGDTSTAVVFPVDRCRIATSVVNGSPYSILRSLGSVAGFAMSYMQALADVMAKTSAGPNRPSLEMPSPDYLCTATVTKRDPTRLTESIAWSLGNHQEAVEPLSHVINLDALSHGSSMDWTE